ncbi:D-alanyl-D-alanine carboxypeptidase family protein [Aestuariivirga sp.]|uniref:D-alanyl-D-alanine carboxypeptidase family protein n=1 Tax=Aestuariivirga sp. TaxID=2650926 RepID=UPI0039E26A9B
MRFAVRFAFLLLVSLMTVAAPAAAQALGDETYVSTARAAILMDAKSGRIFYEKDADTPLAPGSMSKLMTQAVVMDLVKSNALSPDTMFTVSTNAWKKGGAASKGTTMYAKAKSEISVLNLLRGSIIASGNDACITLAEGIDGKEQTFVNRMNTKAEEIGLKNSSFRNSTGLADPAQKMSVRDLALLARYIILNHPAFFTIYSEKSFNWSDINQPSRNPLLVDYPGADGMQTGFTKDGGYGIVGTVERDGRRLIMVLAGMPSVDERKAEAEKMLDWGLSKFRAVEVYAEGDRVGRARVWGGKDDWVDLVTKTSFSVALTKEERKTAEVKLTYKGPLLAPVKAGDEVGIVKVFIEGRVVAELPVMTSTSVDPVDSMWQKALDSAMIMAFGG